MSTNSFDPPDDSAELPRQAVFCSARTKEAWCAPVEATYAAKRYCFL